MPAKPKPKPAPKAVIVTPKKSAAIPSPERASANLTLQFGLVSIPVALKPLWDDLRKKISGTTLCPTHMVKVSQRYICEADGEHLMTKGETVIGYETSKSSGEYVVLPDAVVDAIVADRTGDLDIETICERVEIDPSFLEKPYLVWPQNVGKADAFDLLSGVLREEKLAALCKGVLTTKRTRQIAFMWSDHHETVLAYPVVFDSQMRVRDIDAARLGAAMRKQITKQHLEAAKPLLSQLNGSFDPADVVDTYTPAMLELIAAAAAGEIPTVEPQAADVETDAEEDIDALLLALKASVKAPDETTEKPAKGRARAKAKTAS